VFFGEFLGFKKFGFLFLQVGDYFVYGQVKKEARRRFY
jgi:hypothetical protein